MSVDRSRRKPKLLFDEGLPRRQSFPHLIRYSDVKHIEHDYGRGGLPDLKVYALANDRERILVTFNVKDFRPLVTPATMSVIGVSMHLTEEHMDTKLTSLMRGLKPSQFSGRYFSITGETRRQGG